MTVDSCCIRFIFLVVVVVVFITAVTLAVAVALIVAVVVILFVMGGIHRASTGRQDDNTRTWKPRVTAVELKARARRLEQQGVLWRGMKLHFRDVDRPVELAVC